MRRAQRELAVARALRFTRRGRAALAPLLAVLVAPTVALRAASAQPVRVGYVQDFKPLGALLDCPSGAGGRVVDSVTIQHLGEPPRPARRGGAEEVRLGDSVRVEPPIGARIRVDSRAHGDGAFYLAPQLLCGVRLSAQWTSPAEATPGRRQVATAVYGIAGRRTDTLEFTVRRGAAIVQWNRGSRQLLIHAGAHTIPITGTEVAVAVDPEANLVLIYVISGTVVLGTSGTTATAGQLWRLPGPGAPNAGAPALHPGEAAGLRESIRYHMSTLWAAAPGASKPLYKRWWFWPVVVVVVTLGVLAATSGDGSTPDQQHDGKVEIRIPF